MSKFAVHNKNTPQSISNTALLLACQVSLKPFLEFKQTIAKSKSHKTLNIPNKNPNKNPPQNKQTHTHTNTNTNTHTQ